MSARLVQLVFILLLFVGLYFAAPAKGAEAASTVFHIHGTAEVRIINPANDPIRAEINPEQTVCVDLLLDNVTTGENVEMGAASCLLPQQVPGEIFPQVILLYFTDGVLALAPDPKTDVASIVNEFSTGVYVDVSGSASAFFSGVYLDLDLDYLDDPTLDSPPVLPELGISVTVGYYIILNLDSPNHNATVDCVEELIGLSCPPLQAELACPADL